MDRRMPVMDGVEATRHIRRLSGGDQVKIVAVTASAFREQQEELKHAGMDDYVSKPYHFDEIYQCLGRQLGLRFTYQNQPEPLPAAPRRVTAEQLAPLAAELRDELQTALESLDSERIGAAINAISAIDSALGQQLSDMVDAFQHPWILSVLDSLKQGRGTS
jgi:CheY-like chemotaxis protein